MSINPLDSLFVYPIKAAAQRGGTTKYSLYAMIHRKDIQPVLLKGRLYISEIDIQRLPTVPKRQDSEPRREMYRGVYYDRPAADYPYMAHITIEGRHKYLGFYQTAEDAALAYDEAALERYGDDAITNFPPDVVRQQKRIIIRASRSDNQTGLRGVKAMKDRDSFMARITKDGKEYFLGYFDDPIDAAFAYDDAAREMFGERAKLNFPTVN